MRRIVSALGAGALVLMLMAGCSSGTKSATTPTTAKPLAHPVTLNFSVAWSGDDVNTLKGIIGGFERDHPGVTVNVVGSQSDTAKLIAAINAGQPPDLDANYSLDNLGKFCTTGAFTDLGPRMAHDKISDSIFPPVARAATVFQGRRCALPYISDAFGLYYNKAMLAKAGIAGPPKTLSELTADAKKLTELNPDGSIRVAGFVPLVDFYENYIIGLAPLTGAPYFDRNGKASMSDPRWVELFQWQKQLVDFYGYDKLQKFATSAGDEYSASNGFENGKIAMELDGEWRTQLIAKEHPELDYDTAPMPVADDHPELYGSSELAVGLLGIPKGSPHPDLAWELAKYLAVNTGPLVQFASALHNVPTTTAALTSPSLSVGPKFGPFLQAFANPQSSYPTILPQGSVYFDPITNFAERWQSGKVADLGGELAKLDHQIDSLVAQS